MMDKQALRESIWRRLEAEGVVTFPKPARGRIPNFVGSKEAAEKLRGLAAYRLAKLLMVNPDAAQLAVRRLALRDGKQLLMATPKLRKGFILLNPTRIKNFREAATIGGAFRHGQQVDLKKVKVDLIVQGSVAVDGKGGRLGKGGGFGDLELAILKEVGVINDTTPIVTTVHELQIVKEVPMTDHDMPVDFIATPERMTETEHRYSKPKGIIWELLSPDDLKRMPILAELGKR